MENEASWRRLITFVHDLESSYRETVETMETMVRGRSKELVRELEDLNLDDVGLQGLADSITLYL